jgi:cell division protein FtsB
LNGQARLERWQSADPEVESLASENVGLRQRLEARDAQLIETAKEANDIQRELEDLHDQNDLLKDQLGR